MHSATAIALASGNAHQALVVAGITISNLALAGLAAIYYPPRVGKPALLKLDEASVDVLTLALAHHYLEHRSLPFYAYSPDGAAVYDAPRETREAQAWAMEFAANC